MLQAVCFCLCVRLSGEIVCDKVLRDTHIQTQSVVLRGREISIGGGDQLRVVEDGKLLRVIVIQQYLVPIRCVDDADIRRGVFVVHFHRPAGVFPSRYRP